MPAYHHIRKSIGERRTWRDIQHTSRRRSYRRPLFRLLLAIFILPVSFILCAYRTTGGDAHHQPNPASYARIQKSGLPVLLKGSTLINATNPSFYVTVLGNRFHIKTSLDASLQKYLNRRLKRSTSRYIGIVVMEPSTGRILSMVGYDKTDQKNNPCLDNRYPAASIFKIVTAAAAIETHGFQADTVFNYNGSKYTLYRNQLKERKNRYTHQINLQDSFAQSVNPVFGKIGANRLGKTVLEQYGIAFGFNRYIDFEIPLTPSELHLTEEPYQWAEVASGFNRETTLSPLHGALMMSAILNGGQMVEPAIIDKVEDNEGRVLYQHQTVALNQVIMPETSLVLNRLMQATVKSGTSRKAFRGHRRDRVLSKLTIGGKTGSINNKSQDARFDWFVGFAKEKKGSKELAISVVVAHEKYIGIRAGQYAQMAIKRHFKAYFSRDVAVSEKRRNSS